MKESNLYFREGGSDKEYHAKVEKKGSGYVVNFAYGRRGAALTTGTKTQSPVKLEEAEKVFEKLVKEKMAKGYTSSEDGKSFAMSDNAGRVSGLLPQLLNPVDEVECERLLKDDSYGMQEKFDGKRIMIKKSGDVIEGSNRKGLIVSLPQNVVDVLDEFSDFIIDGELIGENYYVFDCLRFDGRDMSKLGYAERWKEIALNFRTDGNGTVIANLWEGKEKQKAFDEFKQKNKEGVVFKRLDAPYHAGRPNSGGNQLKHKFYATCSALVGGVNKQRSVSLLLFDKDVWTDVGNVTIPPNKDVPSVDDVVEIKYLYAYKGGSLYQPQYLGVRDDVDKDDCELSQLKYKGEEVE